MDAQQYKYMLKMGVASFLLLAKTYLASLLLVPAAFSELVSIYYLANVVVVVLPFGGFLFAHSELAARIASKPEADRNAYTGAFVGTCLIVISLLALVVLAAATIIANVSFFGWVVLYSWAYSVSQIIILAKKLSRDYDRYAEFLVIRAIAAFSVVLLALFLSFDVFSLILLESAAVLAVGLGLGRNIALSLMGARTFLRRMSTYFVPSVVAVVYSNADRLLATAVLPSESLARFGVIYLLVSVFGTLIQFLNVKFLPELFVSKLVPGQNRFLDLFSSARWRSRRWLRWGIFPLLFLVTYIGCELFSRLTTFEYSSLELMLVAIMCIARLSELIGSYGIVYLTANRVAFVQLTLLGTIGVGWYWWHPVELVPVFLFPIAISCLYVILILAWIRLSPGTTSE